MSDEKESLASSTLSFTFGLLLSVVTLWVAGYVVVAYWDWFGGYVMHNPPQINHLAGSALLLLAGLASSHSSAILLSKVEKSAWKIEFTLLFIWLLAYPLGWFYHWILFHP